MNSDPTDGIFTIPSPWSFEETVKRFEELLAARKIKVFCRIDQAEEARLVGLKLRPTTLFIFGDPNKGTPLMLAHPSFAIDLPLKALVWQSDSSGEVLISLNSPEFLQQRHSLPTPPFAEVIRLLTALVNTGS